MGNEIQIEYRLGRQELILLARLVRGLEKWAAVGEVPPALRAEIEQAAQVATAVRDAIKPS